jgi:hypothetical protein
MPDQLPVTLDDMIRELRREVEGRRTFYARAVRERWMNKRRADRQFDVMEATLNYLEGIRDGRGRSPCAMSSMPPC